MTLARVLLLFTAAYTVAAVFEVEVNSMRIREPAGLAGEFDVALGDFGIPAYGATLLAELIYYPDNADGCQPYPSLKDRGGGSDLPLIVLSRRGSCYFVEKAWNAQQGGASAALVMDNIPEGLLTMSNPEDRPEIAKLKDDVSIPCALVQKMLGDKLMKHLVSPDAASVVVELDWTDTIVHPDGRVEWEFWTSSNDGCGRACDRQGAFKREFQPAAMQFEQHGYTSFAPHFMHHKCPAAAASTEECRANCINEGRYCAFDSISDELAASFQPRQVVMEDKRQLCVFQQAAQRKEPWLWWRYAAAFSGACTMANGRFASPDCAEGVLRTLGLDVGTVAACMGDSEANEDHPLLQADLQAQGSQWDSESPLRILLLPTVIINANQYRGRLDGASITRALCAGFAETTEPEVCLSGTLQADDCAEGNGGCWALGNASACVDTFRGRTCQCPQGYRGDGLHCEDVDECAEGSAACDQACTNTLGGYECSCKAGFRLFGGHSTVGLCLPKDMCGAAEDAQCEMGCITRDGQALCTCDLAGLELDQQDQRSCRNVNECATGNAGCQQQCVDLDPRQSGQGFTCACEHGSVVDPSDKSKCMGQGQILQWLGVEDVLKSSTPSAASKWGVIAAGTAAAFAAVLMAGAAVYHFRMRYHMQHQIREIMKQYMPLDGDEAELEGQQKQRVAAQLTATPLKETVGSAAVV